MTVKTDEKKGTVGAEGAAREFGKGGPAPKVEPRAGLSDEQNEDLRRRLNNAARRGNVKEVRGLLKAGADVDARDLQGFTALVSASECGHKQVAKVLMAHGADVNVKNRFLGETALTWVSKREIAEFLISNGADVNARNNQGQTVLTSASFRGHKQTVEVLLAHGVKVDARDEQGATALMWASCHRQEEVVDVLIAHGADVNARTTNGATALMMASARGNIRMVKLLAARGADVDARDNEGETALILASRNKDIEMIKTLIRLLGQKAVEKI
jgi:cytohesin